ncbi:response regulator [Geodermatophilus marinus]|nr:response regulator [Geodermatophilus sp. LHW52908]
MTHICHTLLPNSPPARAAARLLRLRHPAEARGRDDRAGVRSSVGPAHPGRRTDVVLLDVHLPDAGTGLALLARLARAAVRVVAMSAAGGVRGAALAAGAAGFVEQDGATDVLLEALFAAGAGAPPTAGPGADGCAPRWWRDRRRREARRGRLSGCPDTHPASWRDGLPPRRPADSTTTPCTAAGPRGPPTDRRPPWTDAATSPPARAAGAPGTGRPRSSAGWPSWSPPSSSAGCCRRAS